MFKFLNRLRVNDKKYVITNIFKGILLAKRTSYWDELQVPPCTLLAIGQRITAAWTLVITCFT